MLHNQAQAQTLLLSLTRPAVTLQLVHHSWSTYCFELRLLLDYDRISHKYSLNTISQYGMLYALTLAFAAIVLTSAGKTQEVVAQADRP